MAASRLERIGTIYSRAKGLLQYKGQNWEDRPLWYDIYEAFPPKEEPRYDRPAPNIPLQKIFYEEDRIRAIFHKNNKNIGAINIFSNQRSVTQHFIDIYKKLETKYEGSVPSERLYCEAMEMLKHDRQKRGDRTEEQVSLTDAFQEAKSETKRPPPVNINVTEILKD